MSDISPPPIVKKFKYQSIKQINAQGKRFYESSLLKLNSNKSKKYLGWSCVMTFSQTIKMVTEWYKNYYIDKEKISNLTYVQIKQYEKLLKDRKK